jgi:tRNA(fMet)-specific endonuclease VapC
LSFILDTNALSALMLGQPAAVARLRGLGHSEVRVPQPVIAEIQYGLARLTPSRRKTDLQARFAIFARELTRALWSDEVSAEFGRLKALLEYRGERLDDFDIAIAAHATAEGATLVTANTRHMTRIPGLTIADWTAPTG